MLKPRRFVTNVLKYVELPTRFTSSAQVICSWSLISTVPKRWWSTNHDHGWCQRVSLKETLPFEKLVSRDWASNAYCNAAETSTKELKTVSHGKRLLQCQESKYALDAYIQSNVCNSQCMNQDMYPKLLSPKKQRILQCFVGVAIDVMQSTKNFSYLYWWEKEKKSPK